MKKLKKRAGCLNSLLFLILLPPLFFIGCGGGGGDVSTSSSIQKTIGPEGGVIEVTDPNSQLFGVKVEIPENTVEDFVVFTISAIDENITPPSNNQNISIGLDINCEASLNKPITITCPTIRTIEDEDIVIISNYEVSTNQWSTLPIINYDQDSNKVTFIAYDLSFYYIQMFMLSVPDEIQTDFDLETDCLNEEFKNDGVYCGTGVCYGMANFSVWYYFNHGHGLRCLWNKEKTAKAACSAHNTIYKDTIWVFIVERAKFVYGLLLQFDQAGVKNDILYLLNKNQPVVLAMFPFLTEGEGHAVVVTGYKKINGDMIEFYCYDVNRPMIIKKVNCSKRFMRWEFTCPDYPDYDIFYPAYLGYLKKVHSNYAKIIESQPPDDNVCDVPNAPINIQAFPGDRKVTISWQSGDNAEAYYNRSPATSYNLYYSTTPGVSKSNYDEKLTNVTSPKEITNLTNGTTYYFVVTGVNSTGESDESDEVAATPEKSTGTYEFVRMWPTLPQPWYFLNPYDVAVDSSGNVYVADTNIQKFDSSGNFITKWGSQGIGDGEFTMLEGIVVDASGNVYVVDNQNYSANYRIQKFDSSGNFITKWGSQGIGDGEFNRPRGIAVDASGNVYVADSNNHRIQKFDSSGNFITKWGSRGSGDGQFENPRGIAVDALGNIYVADALNYRIQKFDSSGNFITKWGSYGSGDGEFKLPQAISVDSSAQVYVIDECDSIKKFNSNGNFITKFGRVNCIPAGIAVDALGNVYGVNPCANSILKFDSSGNLIIEWKSSGSDVGQFNKPTGITVDTSGNIYVADRYNYRIQKFDSNGNFSLQIYGFWPLGISVDTSGNVYMTDTNNHNVQKFDINGNLITKWGEFGIGDGEFLGPNDIAVDTLGYVYVADHGFYNNDYRHARIQKFDSSGNFITKWGSYGSGDGEFKNPFGIVADVSGNVYVADSYNHRIQKFDSSGNFITKWGGEGYGEGQFSHPNGVAVDASGNIYVADSWNSRIQKFDSSGNFITKFGSKGSDYGEFHGPWDIAVDALGYVYVTDSTNNRVQAFRKSTNTTIVYDFTGNSN